jgi:hypothetical protein
MNRAQKKKLKKKIMKKIAKPQESKDHVEDTPIESKQSEVN